MKTTLLALFFVLLVGNSLFAQETSSDYAGVEKAVNYYLEGGTNNDFETLKKAFHETASMRYLTKDGYQDVNALEFFGSRMKPGPKSNRKTRVVHIDVAGHAATARLEIDYETFSFIDYMTLLKIDGEWKIVSKVFYRRNRPVK
ncbi:MAG: nuclear transport factor 2 family protein [Bacteroidota bacterium]